MNVSMGTSMSKNVNISIDMNENTYVCRYVCERDQRRGESDPGYSLPSHAPCIPQVGARHRK